MINDKEYMSLEFIDGMALDRNKASKLSDNLLIDRPIYRQSQINVTANYEKPKVRGAVSRVLQASQKFQLKKCILSLLPLLGWLPKYSVKRDLLSDTLSGITVAVMHIPQGIGYALLANVPPVIGIYMAFFPVLAYVVFSSSRHNSMGTFAVVCLMVGKVVQEHSSELPHHTADNRLISGAEFAALTGNNYTSVEVASAVTFTTACFLLILFLLRMGKMATIMSETLVNAFTTASAIHVVMSQIRDLFGLEIHKRVGLFRIVYTIRDIVLAIPNANVPAVVISAVSIVIMVVNNEVIKPKLAKYTKIPVPIELIAVALGTTLSYYFDFQTVYNLTVVGEVPTGFPAPTLPKLGLIPLIYVDAFLIGVISYCISISMGLLFAHKAHYEISPNQELLAMSIGNFVGSVFTCLPITASLSRSLIQYLVGGKTQIASIVSCVCLSVVLLWIGPAFHSLPRCILASIILVALKGMLWQMSSLVRFWKLSKWDAAIWIGTVVVTVFVDISLGLLFGVTLSLISILYQSLNPYSCLLANVPDTDLYLDPYRYKETREIDGVKIFHYAGSLNFAARGAFKKYLAKRIDFDVAAVLAELGKLDDNSSKLEEGSGNDEYLVFRILILDFSAITYIDPAGVEFLRLLTEDFARIGVEVYIAGASSTVVEMFNKCDRIDKIATRPYTIYPTIHDAVLSAKIVIKSK